MVGTVGWSADHHQEGEGILGNFITKGGFCRATLNVGLDFQFFFKKVCRKICPRKGFFY